MRKRNFFERNFLIGKILILVGLVLNLTIANAQTATWIWYPGDFEISLANQVQNRRTERGSFFPPFWRLDNHYVLMDFHKDVELNAPETVLLAVEGNYILKLDGKAFAGTPRSINVPAGKHRISIKVFNQANVPAIYVKGNTIVSDSSWLVTFEDKEWIDETGKVSDQSGTKWLKAGSWNFNSMAIPPSTFRLPVTAHRAIKTTRNNNTLLVDFGKETFGFIKLHGMRGQGKLNIYYGESQEEALATASCETLDRLDVQLQRATDSILPLSKAFRYVYLETDASVQLDSVSMLYEYAALEEKGSFRCSDTLINKIYDVAKYTFQLNTREFFIDGIKRDRWIWSGDAYQSYLMNYYLFYDAPTVTRTLLALRGKDPVTSHINTIMDYTFYWFLGIYDYYLYTGDKSFMQQVYPRMQSLMDFCLSRRNANGLMEGLAGDWVFIDWAEGLSKKGEVSFEQLLLARSLETMAICAGLAGDAEGEKKYDALASQTKDLLFKFYWNDQKQALVHSRVNGQPTDKVTRYANMFAIFFNYFDKSKQEAVKKSVLLNDSIQKITTPYMRFYELEALCALGEQSYVLKEMKDYWGGMLNLGATSFWEEYNPAKKGVEHLAMYGRPFGKSLCHAWGASPLYLLGKYYLGVRPIEPGYKVYFVEPKLGGLEWMQGKVPVPGGSIDVFCSKKQIRVKSPVGEGILFFASKTKPVCRQGVIQAISKGQYMLIMEKNKEHVISYNE